MRARGLDFAQRAADGGSAGALRWMGYLHESGSGVTRSLSQAVGYYRRAAELGDVVAMCLLGELQYFGMGTPIDRESGLRWLDRGAQGGNADGKRLTTYLRSAKYPMTRRPFQPDGRTQGPSSSTSTLGGRRPRPAMRSPADDMMQAYTSGLGVPKERSMGDILAHTRDRGRRCSRRKSR
jgi:TPR repeat protein